MRNPSPFPATIPAPIVYTRKDVCALLGLSTTALDRSVAAGIFPPPIRLAPRRVAWIRADVDAWLDAARARAAAPSVRSNGRTAEACHA